MLRARRGRKIIESAARKESEAAEEKEREKIDRLGGTGLGVVLLAWSRRGQDRLGRVRHGCVGIGRASIGSVNRGSMGNHRAFLMRPVEMNIDVVIFALVLILIGIAGFMLYRCIFTTARYTRDERH